MFAKSGVDRSKTEIDVVLALSGEAKPQEASVFVAHGERVTDLLNDSRGFIPVRLDAGDVAVIAKSTILSITEKNQMREDDAFEDTTDETAARTRTFDPYEVLRIARDADLEAVRRAYKMRIKAVHPDAVAALDLDEDLKRAAQRAAQRVNHAYKAILKERNAENASS
ncbi:MAG: DnaJ domain-containing protein [Pseudomonadota bacterium]